MKIKLAFVIVALAALLAVGITSGCQRARSNDQISQDVRNKIGGDQAVQNKQLNVTAKDGVVTLSGNVGSEDEFSAAAADAAQVDGVKTVVNNLRVTSPQVAQQQEPTQLAPAPQPEPQQEARPAYRSKPSGAKPVARHRERESAPPPVSSAPAEPQVAENHAPVTPPPPPEPPKPVEVTIPDGTTLSIRLVDALSSETSQVGDRFRATLDSPISLQGGVVIPAGADITGRVTNAKSAAHFKGSSELALELTRISVNGKSYELHTDQYARQGTARGKNTAAKVGGGAALGAIIGGIAGGGKGAAIGAAVGAGAGGTAQAVTRGEKINLNSEQVLAFHLERPLTVLPAATRDRDQGRQKLEYSE